MAKGGDLAVGQRVQVRGTRNPGARGRIVEDFGDAPGHAVTIGETRIAEPSRRWAVQLDDGNLVFADSEDLDSAGAD